MVLLLFKFLLFPFRYNDAIGPDVFYVEEAQETLKHIQKIGITILASKWITSNARPEVIPYEEHAMTKVSSSITENLLGLIKSSDAQIVPPKQNVNPTNKKLQELPSILKKRSSEDSPMISGSGKLQYMQKHNMKLIQKFFTLCILFLLSAFVNFYIIYK